MSDPLTTISGILWIGKDYLLAKRSSTLNPSSIILIDIRTNPFTVHQVSQPETVFTEPMKRLIVPGSFVVSPTSFYYGPTGDNFQPNSIPLVVIPHGGKF